MNGKLSRKVIAAIRGPEILDDLPDGVYLTDLDRKIVFWSRAAERILGWTAADVVGRNCSDNILVHVDKDGHELCGKEYCPLHRSIVTGEPSAEPLLVYARHRSGARVPVEVSVAPIRNAAGEVVGGIELFRDLGALERDLVRAHHIQESLLVSDLAPDPRVTFGVRYTPSEIVGGDFYRIERLDGTCYAMMVADVMGHGVASALYTMQLRSLWEDWRSLLGTPAEFAGILSRKLRVLAGDAGYFATAVILVADVATGEVRFVSAGHPAPILLVAGDGALQLGQPQPAIGMLDDVNYQEDRCVLEPGASLLLYTDGAIEACDLAGRELGVEGLARLLEAPDCRVAGVPALDRLEERILKYSGALHPADDLTLIAVTRNGGG